METEKKNKGNVKFDKEKQQRIKFFSKFISILAILGKVVVSISIIGLLIAMVATPVLVKNIKVNEDSLEIFSNKVTYENKDNKIDLKIGDTIIGTLDNDEIAAFNLIISELKNTNIPKAFGYLELYLASTIAVLVLTYLALSHTEKLFNNIHNDNTPFTLDNVNHIKKVAYFLIAIIITSFVCELLSSLIFNYGIFGNVNIPSLLFVLIVITISYIFEYGYELQKNSKARMYDE